MPEKSNCYENPKVELNISLYNYAHYKSPAIHGRTFTVVCLKNFKVIVT